MQRGGDRVIVDDCSRGARFGYRPILHGTVMLRQKLHDLLDRSISANPRGGKFFVALLAPNGYEFIVGTLAVLALGGVVVPMREFSLSLSPFSFSIKEKKRGLMFFSRAELTTGGYPRTLYSDRRTPIRSSTYPAAVRCMLSPCRARASRAGDADPRRSRDPLACGREPRR